MKLGMWNFINIPETLKCTYAGILKKPDHWIEFRKVAHLIYDITVKFYSSSEE
jgi:hypothetical protein